MAIVIEASPEIGRELQTWLEARGLAPVAHDQRNLAAGDVILQIVLAFAPVALTEILHYLRSRNPHGDGPAERAVAQLKITIDGERVSLEQLARPGEIDRIAREREDI